MIMSCSLYHDPNVVANLIHGVSGAMATYEEIIDDHRSLHGVMGLSRKLLDEYELTLDDAHDVCVNIQVGSAVLQQFYIDCRSENGDKNADLCALFRYAEGFEIAKNRVIIRNKYTFSEPVSSDEMSLISEKNDALHAPLSMVIDANLTLENSENEPEKDKKTSEK